MAAAGFIRKMGNTAAHTGKRVSKEQAAPCLENLFVFMDYVAYCYADQYTERHLMKSAGVICQTKPGKAADTGDRPGNFDQRKPGVKGRADGYARRAAADLCPETA